MAAVRFIAAFFAGAFLAADFLAGALVAAFLAALAAFLAGAFFAAFLARREDAAFDGWTFRRETLRSRDNRFELGPGRNAGTDVGFTLTVSPVRGLRATRAARWRCSKTPKPVIVTLSPLCTARTMVSTTFSTAAVADRRSVPIFSVSTSMSSALFIQNPPKSVALFGPTRRHGKPLHG
ncbi:hypothetical protein I552_4805 [Mycobacterium xenopi 3993]|nr:hypothetical protein I552_4805 [Mycobacterium xenopi 3993]